ncbi:adhesive plaque matrix protein 2-like [Saccostrea cucullata]|uniref:adhesive plaque matrix protein 2-like n=1 Tax=Saccostrea cuccullata TaxID=36930 RepID=UPI002ED6B743
MYVSVSHLMFLKYYVHVCHQHECQKGVCEADTTSARRYKCNCLEGYKGKNCDVHVCDHHNCQNGTCEADTTSARGYKCNCVESYEGEICEVHVCDQHDCQNGTCEADTTSARDYKCNCLEGYKGKNCEVHVCDQHVCQKGTCEPDTCNTRTRGYKCNCMEGYKGENCQVDVCNQHDCQNGTCEADKTRTRGYQCNCVEGYEGENCEARSCPHPWIKHNNYCFLFSDDKLDWADASRKCRSIDSILAEPTTQDINNFIVSKMIVQSEGSYYWLGGSDLEDEGKFVWTSRGQPFSFTFWIDGDPNDAYWGEDCVLANWHGIGRWVDHDCSMEEYYICQREL